MSFEQNFCQVLENIISGQGGVVLVAGFPSNFQERALALLTQLSSALPTRSVAAPSSPTVGQRWDKLTAQGEHVESFYWNGTYWLSTRLYSAPLGGVWSGTANIGVGIMSLPSFAIGGYIDSLRFAYQVLTTSDGSNYYTFNATIASWPWDNKGGVGSNGGGTQFTSPDINTSGAAPGVKIEVDAVITVPVHLASTSQGVTISATKTGSPGSLYAGGTMFYRLIGG